MKTHLLIGVCWLMPALAWAGGPMRLQVLPEPRVLHAPARTQQLAVRAHFSDGTVRDVTRLTAFTSSDTDVASVNQDGLVTFKQTGEAVILCRYLTTTQGLRLTFVDPKPGYQWPDPPEINFIDKLVFAQLKRLHIPPSDRCPDTVFLRRAHLDLCGVLPTAEEVRSFLADPAKDKRAKVIERLLDRPEWADMWTFHWVDSLRINPNRLGVKSAQAYRDWIHAQVKTNTSVDRFVRALLTAQGHSDKDGAVNYFRMDRKPNELAVFTANVFLGVRLECAGCHDHFSASWTQDDYHGFAAFFAQVVRTAPTKRPHEVEIVGLEMKNEWLHPQTRQIVPARFLAGPVQRFQRDQDRRAVLADWLTAPDNPFFARAFVNRVWSKMFGRGIVEPIEDFRLSNPSANDELLDALARDFTAHRHDPKHLLRTIANSRTYQLATTTSEFNKADKKYFSHRLQTPLYAEQLFDAVVVATEVPEKFAGMPAGTRAVQVLQPFPPIIGISGPARASPCEAHPDDERAPNRAHAIHFMQGNEVTRRIEAPKNRVGRLLKYQLTDQEMMEELFLTILSRLPTENDARMVHDHLRRDNLSTRRKWEDVMWALFNTREFACRQ